MTSNENFCFHESTSEAKFQPKLSPLKFFVLEEASFRPLEVNIFIEDGIWKYSYKIDDSQWKSFTDWRKVGFCLILCCKILIYTTESNQYSHEVQDYNGGHPHSCREANWFKIVDPGWFVLARSYICP